MDSIEAQAATVGIEDLRIAIGGLDYIILRLEHAEGCSDLFMDAATGLHDKRVALEAKLRAAEEAIGEYDAMKSYGDRPSQVALVADGASP